MNLAEFTRDVHQNAVEHGWWDDERDYATIIALIHSEWSEALEAYRNHEPMVWHKEKDGHQKPEGFAVEMIDGCIRILDLAGKVGRNVYLEEIKDIQKMIAAVPQGYAEMSETQLIANCHAITSDAFAASQTDEVTTIDTLIACMFCVFAWMQAHDLYWEAIIREKHEYNKTRPYRHGNKRV